MYGGMPIQIGYCVGANTKLNCLEYHRDCEVNVTVGELVLMLAKVQDIEDGKLDTSKVEFFALPAGTGVQLYETTLHYAPAAESGFRVAVALPLGTNTAGLDIAPRSAEDKLLLARNKWLLAHPDADEAKNGAYVGLTGKNIDLSGD
jgi:hypothetical protein